MKKSYLSWNKDTVKDDVIFEHLYELSDGKFDLREHRRVTNTTDLLRTNKRTNKITPPGQPKIQSNKNTKNRKSKDVF
jgi:hypothetical protein